MFSGAKKIFLRGVPQDFSQKNDFFPKIMGYPLKKIFLAAETFTKRFSG
jgi:hypothetical protein